MTLSQQERVAGDRRNNADQSTQRSRRHDWLGGDGRRQLGDVAAAVAGSRHGAREVDSTLDEHRHDRPRRRSRRGDPAGWSDRRSHFKSEKAANPET